MALFGRDKTKDDTAKPANTPEAPKRLIPEDNLPELTISTKQASRQRQVGQVDIHTVRF